MKVFLFSFGVLFFSTAGFLQPQPKTTYQLRFYKIDNQVKVYVNDKQVFESEIIDGNPELDLRVSLDKYLQKGINTLKVELYNGSSLNEYKSDTNWEIRYELFESGESSDYMHQTSTKGKKGLSADFQHDIIVR